MVKRRFIGYSRLSFSDFSAVTMEYTPAFKWLGQGISGGLETHQVLMQCNETKDDFDNMSLDDKERESTDDEIEDW
jgi:hypothetical protein